jgi:tRNA threonylcarbamoyladenosine biosynthesis protein TsaE
MSDDLTLFLPHVNATFELGQKLGESLIPNSVLLLDGELGAGKTTLIQGLGSGLGIKESIVSPTFTLINEYTQGRLPLYHLDLYRLEKKEIDALCPEMYWEGIEVEPGITAIEWSERLPYKPSNYIQIKLEHSSQQGRIAQFTFCLKQKHFLHFLFQYANLDLDK